MFKECRSCKIIKTSSEFPKRSSNLDGLYSYCRKCCSDKNKKTLDKNREKHRKKCNEYRQKNREYLNKKSKEYYYKNRELQLKQRSEYRKKYIEKISFKEALKRISDKDRFERNRKKHLEWSKDNRDRLNAYQKEWYQKNKEKRRAHVILNRAIKSAGVVRPNTCSQCNKECKPDGHHEDYSKPLDIIWLCRACHSRKSPRTKIHVFIK